jgi:hypothetical protein
MLRIMDEDSSAARPGIAAVAAPAHSQPSTCRRDIIRWMLYPAGTPRKPYDPKILARAGTIPLKSG